MSAQFRFTMSLALCGLFGLSALAAGPCESGPAVGQRPGPYSFLMATGDKRGKQHCYICETAEKPAVIVFARATSEPLGKLLLSLDKQLGMADIKDLRSWATFLSDDQPALDPKLAKWSRDLGLSRLPVGVFEDRNGPPSYKLADDAEVTVLFAVNQRVVANFAFRAGELTEEKVKEVMAALPKALNGK